jgi:pimeloyl-ACP methyl ester carboxylesterase
MTRAFLLAMLLSIASGGSVAPSTVAPRAELQTRACTLPDLARRARCGILLVRENPDRPDSRAIKIHFAVLPAASGTAQRDPIAILMGGPGESAIEAAAYYANWLSPVLNDRDLLLMDQRGVGSSAPLRCWLYSAANPSRSLRDLFPAALVAGCRRNLERRADLTRYTNEYVARDLEQLRRSLGYGELNLFAGSYGTRAAQVYMRAYPASVRTAYLGSVVPIDSGGPLHFARIEEAAIHRMLADCSKDAACNRAYPDLEAELRQAIERLESGKITARIAREATPLPLVRGRVAEWFRSKLYRPSSTADLPWLIHRAFGGDWTPIANGILENARGADRNLSLGVLFSITCNEDLPFVDEPRIMSETRGTILGDYRIRQQQGACRVWPKRRLPKGIHNPVRSNVPTLFVTGDHDGGTPLWFTDHVARGFTNKAIVIVRGQGHTEWNLCVAGVYARLLRTASTEGLTATACPAIPLPPFKTDGN